MAVHPQRRLEEPQAEEEEEEKELESNSVTVSRLACTVRRCVRVRVSRAGRPAQERLSRLPD